MNTSPAGSLRIALVAVLILGVARSAEEKPARATPAAPPVGDSIEVAKREFDAIKSSRESELMQKGVLPRLSTPDLHSTPATPGTWTPAKPSGAEKRPTNWLLEAMEKKPDPRKDRIAGKSERDQIRESSELRLGSEREKTDEPERRGDENRKPESGAINPFARFLGDWMSPQDYALLKPGLDKSPIGAVSSAVNAVASPFGTAAGSTLPGSESPSGLAQMTSVPGSPRPNPYLQSLNLTPPAPTAGLPPSVVSTPVVPARSAPIPAMELPQVPSAKSKVPDFAKPQTDEKYFKQLKRF